MTSPRFLIALCALVATTWVAGCGQTLHIKATRIGTATREYPDPGGELRQALRGYLAACKAFFDGLTDAYGVLDGDGARSSKESAEEKAKYAESQLVDLSDPRKVFDLPTLISKRAEYNQKFGALLKPQTSEALIDQFADDDRRTVRANLDRLRQATDAAAVQVQVRMFKALTSTFGGYATDSVYIINPGSEEWERVKSLERDGNPKLVFSSIDAVAMNDSVLMVVQESPAQFEPRYIEADPETAIRNGLIAINWVLRIAAKVVPLVDVNLGPLSTASAQPQQATETVSLDEAEARLREIAEVVNAIAKDPDLNSLLKKAASGELSLDEKNRLAAKARELFTAMGIEHGPSD